MADISNVDTATIKDLYTSFESLPCKIPVRIVYCLKLTLYQLAL
jgi:D-3-phosphoglycerate dehydrogenase